MNEAKVGHKTAEKITNRLQAKPRPMSPYMLPALSQVITWFSWGVHMLLLGTGAEQNEGKAFFFSPPLCPTDPETLARPNPTQHSKHVSVHWRK